MAWGPILALLLIANVVAGVRFSRLTSIGKVRVVGAAPADQERIRSVMDNLQDKPALGVDPYQVETWLSLRSAVSRTEITRNIFGRAVVRMEYRTPVAKIAGSPGALLARDGVIFQSMGDEPTDLPLVELPRDARKPVLTLAGSWRSGELAGLASEMKKIAPGEQKTLAAEENGGLCLNIGSKFAVRLGLPKRLDEKIDYLNRQLDQDPGLLASGKTLVLVNLDRPSYAQGVAKKEK